MQSIDQDGVLELRQYTLRSGQRDTLISIFERHFIESQNALGAWVRGTFRDLDDPDRFVWLRGFADMPARQRALQAFYGGPVWQANRSAANATMIDSDNVLLLRPAGAIRTPMTGRPEPGAIYGLTIHYLADSDPVAFARFFEETMSPLIVGCGAEPLYRLVTESAPNDFEKLPIRTREPVFAWFGRWQSESSHAAFLRKWYGASGWRDSIPEPLLPALMRKAEVLRLLPTERSAMQ